MEIREKIEQFNCEVCKQKVTISKRTSLAKLPNVLFVHLKRFLNGWLLVCKAADMVASEDSSVPAYERLLTCAEITALK